MKTVNADFCIVEFPPHGERNMWTYATLGMSHFKQPSIELHLFSSEQDYSLVELLTVIAYYHIVDKQLDLGHTVNFGRPWQGNSSCAYGFISLPYLDGPELESVEKYSVKCCWLIPITKEERNFKAEYGIESLEEKFETVGLNFIDINRESAV